MVNPQAQPSSSIEAIYRHNQIVESLFSAFNGVFLGLVLFASPIVAVVGVEVSPLELTIIVSAFPVGAFLGPIWGYLGHRWGMKNLVLTMMFLASVPLLFMFWVTSSAVFTILITFSQLLNSAMRMGQASLYRVVYPQERRGKVLGKLTFWTYVTMVPSVLLTGWLLDKSREMYQIVYPLAGVCGFIGCYFYYQLRVPEAEPKPAKRGGFRTSVQNVERILRQDRLYLMFQLAFFLTGGAFFLSRHVVILLTRDRFAFSAFELSLCLSVIPQLLLALCSPLWGRILDRIGMMRSRLLISVLLSASLGCYFGGLVLGVAALMYVGSVLQGLSNAGGQLTWFLASSHFAPRTEDVPVYNGIHFVLNGVRGLILPWVGSVLFVLSGPGAVLGATLFSLGSVPILLRALKTKNSPADEAALRLVADPDKATTTELDAPGSPGAGSVPLSGKAS